ncbi:MAG: ABC transporter permease [Pseudomonadota bacterium]|nr:ABC transporter permease [Pseudomonadota bacterium]
MATSKSSEPQAGFLPALRASRFMAVIEGLVGRTVSTGPSSIVPAGSVAGRSLTIVMSIMCFLACLTAGAVYLVHQSASAWFSDIASEVTVQVSVPDRAEIEKQVTLVSLFLARQPGITKVSPMSAEDSAALLEPWLGSGAVLAELPVPRLIAVEINRSSPPDLGAIRQALETNFSDVTLDDHRRWQAELRTITRSLALGGIAVLMLVGAASIATVISATRSAMASNREIIEVLHFVGAEDTFIAREFERHFLALGVRAGVMGAGAAAFAFMLLPFVIRLLGGGGLAAAEYRRLIGPAILDWPGYLLFAAVVLAVAVLSMLTSRYGVQSILKAHE